MILAVWYIWQSGRCWRLLLGARLECTRRLLPKSRLARTKGRCKVGTTFGLRSCATSRQFVQISSLSERICRSLGAQRPHLSLNLLPFSCYSSPSWKCQIPWTAANTGLAINLTTHGTIIRYARLYSVKAKSIHGYVVETQVPE